MPINDEQQQQHYQQVVSGGRSKGVKRTAHPLSTLGSMFERGTVNTVVTAGVDDDAYADDAERGAVLSHDATVLSGGPCRSSNDLSTKLDGPGIKVSTRVTSSESAEFVQESETLPNQEIQGEDQVQDRMR